MGSHNKHDKELSPVKDDNKAMHGWLRPTLVEPALWVTFVAAALIAFLGDEQALRSARVDLGGALVQMSATLLGITLAGLAIFVVFLDKRYVTLIEEHFSIGTELWPFQWAAIIAILCLVFGVALIIVGEPCTLLFRFIVFGALWTVAYLLSQIYQLIRFLAEHAKARAKQIHIEDEPEDE